MEITLEKKDSTNANIQVNLKQDDYQSKVAEKLKEYTKKTQLKGFRPGKVPASLIERMYGKSIMVDEINHLLTDCLNNYIKENNLPIIGDPLPDAQKSGAIDWENQKEFVFSYNVGLIPDFKDELSTNLTVSEYEIEVTPLVVEETLTNLKNQFGKMVPAEKVGENDTVAGTLKDGEEEKTVSFILEKASKEGVKSLLGAEVGNTITLEIENLFDDTAVLAHALSISNEEAGQKTGTFPFTINSINRKEPSPLDQGFFDRIFGKDAVVNEEEFMAKLKETIQENYRREADQLLKKDLQKTLVNKTEMELPNEFLKRWLLVTNQGKITEEQIESEYDYYLKELKWNLIKNKIAKNNGIKVENEEVVSKAKAMIMQQFGGMDVGPEMEETLNKIADNYLKQDKGKNYLKIYDEVMVDRVMEMAKAKVSIDKKMISVEEFKNLAS